MKMRFNLRSRKIIAPILAAAMILMSVSQAAFASGSGASRDFKQLANEAGSEKWIGSALNSNNSLYTEGMSVPQRLVLEGLDTTVSGHMVSFEYQFTKGGLYAYDFITSWTQARSAAASFAGQSWPDAWKYMGVSPSVPEGMTLQASPSIPSSAFSAGKEAVYEQGYGDRTIDIYANGTLSNVTVSIDPNLYGSTAGDSSLKFTVSWTGSADKVMILYASHVAVGADLTGSGIGWGPGKGAGTISGAPYHNMLALPSTEWSGTSEDNQMQSAAIVQQSGISGMKFLDANGNGLKDAGEAGLGGWEIWLDLNKNGVKDSSDPSAVTAADGMYSIHFLLAQASEFRVYEVQKGGYIQTYPASGYNVAALVPGSIVSGINFGNFLPNAHITLTKSAAETSFSESGDVIHYTITATNDGNVTLHNVVITDPFLGTLTSVPAAPVTLAPGQSMTANGTHTVTQADLDAGHFYNMASVAGLDPQNCIISDTDDEDVPAIQNPHITLTKIAAETGYDAVNDVIHYTLTATNDGNVTLHGVTITDPLLGTLSFSVAVPAILLPGQSLTASGTYTITQDDLNAGHVLNVASASGLGPMLQSVSDTDDEDVPGSGTPHITLTKSAAETSFSKVGDVIRYELTAENDGDVTLHNVTITDPLLGALDFISAVPATLQPGDTLTATGTHTVTQADLDAGHFYNIATATGLGPQEQSVSDTDNVDVPAIQTPHITLSKVAAEAGFNGTDDVLHYTLTATNDGNVTLHDVVITDPLLGTLTFALSAPATLGPGESLTATGTYNVTQADLDAGHFYNIATVTGLDPQGKAVSDTDDVDVPAVQDPHITLTKAAVETGFDGTDDVLHYTLKAVNDGNVTLTNVTITDPLLATLSFTSVVPATLAPGESLEAFGTYKVTQADLDAGHFYNIAAAAGQGPKGQSVSAVDDADVPAIQNPHITLVKTAVETSYGSVGDVIHYILEATNDGNVTLSNVTIADIKLMDTLTFTPAVPATLAPGETLTATGTHTVTQEDIDAGSYYNSAESSGMAPDETWVSDTDAREIPAVQLPGISVDKTTNGGDGLYIAAGSQVTWKYVVTNTGDVTLSDIRVTDSDFGPVGTIPTLAPGASASLTKTGTAISGPYENTATVIGTPPSGTDVTDTDGSSYFGSAPGILVEKTVRNTTANGPEGEKATGQVGDDFQYRIVVTNTGNVALSNVVIIDDKAVVGSGATVNGTSVIWTSGSDGKAALTIPSLSPGQAVTVLYTYETMPDTAAIAARINTASAAATVAHTAGNPNPTLVSDEDSARISTVLGVTRTGETWNGIGNLLAAAFVLAADGLLVVRRIRRPGKEEQK